MTTVKNTVFLWVITSKLFFSGGGGDWFLVMVNKNLVPGGGGGGGRGPGGGGVWGGGGGGGGGVRGGGDFCRWGGGNEGKPCRGNPPSWENPAAHYKYCIQCELLNWCDFLCFITIRHNFVTFHGGMKWLFNKLTHNINVLTYIFWKYMSCFQVPLLSEWIFLYHHNEQQDQQHHKN